MDERKEEEAQFQTRRHRLTNGYVNGLTAEAETFCVWDTELTGFAVRVNTGGRKAFFFKYNATGRIPRRLTIGKHGVLTAEDARKTAKDLAREVAAGNDPAGLRSEYRDSITVKELAGIFLEKHVKVNNKPGTLTSTNYMLEAHVYPALGSRRIADVEKADILRLHHSMADTPYQANRVLALLKSIFNRAIDWDILAEGKNPCSRISKYKEKARERFLNDDELKRLLAVLDEIDREKGEHPSVTRAIRLLILTGARMGEILTLQWNYIDQKNRRFNLPDSKTGKKTIPVGQAVIDLIQTIPRQNEHDYVIFGPRCGGYFKDIQHQWRRIRQRAGLPDVRIHDLRHTYASLALNRGYSLPMIGKILGHRDIATTQRYAHLASDPVAAAVDDIAGAIVQPV